MKKKGNGYQVIYSFSLLFFLALIGFISYAYRSYYKNYQICSAVIVDYDTLEFMVEDSLYRKLNKNKIIFLDGKNYKIKIKKVVRNILKKNKKLYHQICIQVSLPKKYSLLEVISIAIYDDRCSLITIFKACLKGEENEENG